MDAFGAKGDIMYSGYKLTFEEYDEELYEIGNGIYLNDRAIVERNLERFALSSNTLDGTAIQKSWFPQIKAEVFISHSHADEKYVITLAGFFKKYLGLNTFIDSCVWGYSVDLLREIDNMFCSNGERGSYSYEKRNYSTSHVHMMLATSLLMMLDQTECLIFIDTPNALNTKEVINSTNSPWIYSEIVMSRCIQRKPIAYHRKELSKSIRESYENFSNISYSLDTMHLKEMNHESIKKWRDIKNRNPDLHSLDALYKVLPMEDQNERNF
jgi:hypothetical protein